MPHPAHQPLEPKHWQELQVLARSHTWLLQAENLLLFGPSGVGKTHLAIDIVMAMIEQDQPCSFFPATALVSCCRRPIAGTGFWADSGPSVERLRVIYARQAPRARPSGRSDAVLSLHVFK